MEAIKISVEVSINLSESTQNFIKSLFSAPRCDVREPQLSKSAVPTAQPVAPIPTPAPAAPTQPKKPVTPTAAPAPSKPAATPAPGASAAPAASSASKNIEDVRGMLAKKVNEHREVIKQKLNELGAPSVTKLDPAKYDEMYDFLATL